MTSVCSPGFTDVLRGLGVSLLVSSYRSGKLIQLRADGDTLNTHYHDLARPTGIALGRGRLAIGGLETIEEFRDLKQAAAALQPAGRFDACWLPMASRVTGDIEVHDLAYAEDGRLWFVNTRFSAICTLPGGNGPPYSFEPRWQPPFISALADEDRCHLNGLALVDGRSAYATALGHGDGAKSWREHSLDGGVLMDVAANAVIASGLCLPHSPRWHDGQLWVLNSGRGVLAKVDVDSGRLETVAELPGFLRGLDFLGPYAFVGLSEVRVSTSLPVQMPVAERNDQTLCGAWIVDTRSGKTVAWMRFTRGISQIFALTLLHGQRFPALFTADDPRVANSFLFPPRPERPANTPGKQPGKQRSAELLGRIGEARLELCELDEAAAALDQALALKPEQPAAENMLGVVYRDQGRLTDASQAFARALKLQPEHSRALNNLGCVLKDLGRPEQAITCLSQAAELEPENLQRWNNLGILLHEQHHYPQAEAALRHALAIDADYVDGLNNLGRALHETGRLDEALTTVQRALALDPGSVNGYCTLGVINQALGRGEQAMVSFRRAIDLQADCALAWTNLSFSQLLSGDFEQGWRNYEWRPDHSGRRRRFAGLAWRGNSDGDGRGLAGRRILLHAEQGQGDSIQFVRYARQLAAFGGRVVVQCQPALVRLFARMPELEQVVAVGAPLPDYELHAPLLSLPYILRGQQLPEVNAVSGIATEVPYLLAARQGGADSEIGVGAGASLRVGIVWAGNPKHMNDANRSTPLASFLPLAAIPGVRLYSLQVGDARAELLSTPAAGAVVDLGAGFADFADTADALMALDLVISVDTAVVHLAGALARPVWTLLPFAPDWRWLLGRDDTPWYPTMRLFRQPALGDWDAVFAVVAEALRERVAAAVGAGLAGSVPMARR